jgi:outer membrane protein TolC
VSDDATQYFTVRELDSQLEIERQTFATRQASLDPVRSRRDYRIATQLDLRQAEQLVDTAAVTISTLQQHIEQTENQITKLFSETQAKLSAKGVSMNSYCRLTCWLVCPRFCLSGGPTLERPSIT